MVLLLSGGSPEASGDAANTLCNLAIGNAGDMRLDASLGDDALPTLLVAECVCCSLTCSCKVNVRQLGDRAFKNSCKQFGEYVVENFNGSLRLSRPSG